MNYKQVRVIIWTIAQKISLKPAHNSILYPKSFLLLKDLLVWIQPTYSQQTIQIIIYLLCLRLQDSPQRTSSFSSECDFLTEKYPNRFNFVNISRVTSTDIHIVFNSSSLSNSIIRDKMSWLKVLVYRNCRETIDLGNHVLLYCIALFSHLPGLVF